MMMGRAARPGFEARPHFEGTDEMIWNLAFWWLVLMVSCVSILAFILAMGLNALMGREGFGPVGNAVVLTGGFFLAIFAANTLGYELADMTRGAIVGISGAFVSLVSMAVAKGLLNRL
jgi:sterol desaturase/sphingolipid hydroxylase (fatty acid hydroxylase superfamily)